MVHDDTDVATKENTHTPEDGESQSTYSRDLNL